MSDQSKRHLHFFILFCGALNLLDLIAGKALAQVQNPETPATGFAQAADLEKVLPSTWPAAKAAPEGAPAVVMLPPVIHSDSPEDFRPACELLCDGLAALLNATGKLKVVDRESLEKILKEHRLAPSAPKPAIGFDAMVRLEFRFATNQPKIDLTVIDLSTGNPLEQLALAWPLPNDALAKFSQGVETIANEPLDRTDQRYRVRVLRPHFSYDQPRMFTFVERLNTLCLESLKDSKKLEVVQHLESHSAQEEALLLLLGLSKLGGGRMFVPQSEAVLQTRIREVPVTNTPFEKTPVEIDIQLQFAPNFTGEWETVRGTARDFDKLLQQAWEHIAGKLDGADPQAFDRSLHALQTSRKQAEAEMAGTIPPTIEERVHWQLKVDQAETALKLDPTFELARYEWIYARGYLSAWSVGDGMRKLIPPSVGIENRERFYAAILTLEESPLTPNAKLRDAIGLALHGLTPAMRDLMKSPAAKLSPADFRTAQSLRAICNIALKHQETGKSVHYGWLRTIYRAHRLQGADQKDRVEWLNQVVARALDFLAALPRPIRDDATDLSRFNRWILEAAILLEEDGLDEQAAATILKLQPTVAEHTVYDDQFLPDLQAVVKKLDQQELTATVNRWLVQEKEPPRFISLRTSLWPKQQFPAEESAVTYQKLSKYYYNGQGYGSAVVLAADEQHAYVAQAMNDSSLNWNQSRTLNSDGDKVTFVRVDLDKQGHPIGKLVPKEFGRRTREEWDGFHPMTQPLFADGPLREISAKLHQGQLYLATEHQGLWVYDPKKDAWQRYSTLEGLPTNSLHSIYFIDETTVLCTGYVSLDLLNPTGLTRAIHFTLNLADGSVKIIRQAPEKLGRAFESRLLHVWKDGERWYALGERHYYDDLLSPEGKYTATSGSAVEVATVGDRQFFATQNGLFEFNPQGKVVQSWLTNTPLTILTSSFRETLPSLMKSPAGKLNVVNCGGLLVMPVFEFFNHGMVAYDPVEDCWYGPLMLKTQFQYMSGTPGGLWAMTYEGLCFIKTEDLKAAAIKGGRALKMSEFKLLEADLYKNATTRELALLAVQMADWNAASTAIEAALKEDPTDIELLLLAGLVHDQWNLNQPEKALPYYLRLADYLGKTEVPKAVLTKRTKDSSINYEPYRVRDVAFTGYHLAIRCQHLLKNHEEVIRLAKVIQAEFPKTHENNSEGEVAYWARQAGKALSEAKSITPK